MSIDRFISFIQLVEREIFPQYSLLRSIPRVQGAWSKAKNNMETIGAVSAEKVPFPLLVVHDECKKRYIMDA